MRKCNRKIIGLNIVLCLVMSLFQAIPAKAYMVDNVVSVKTVNTDICVSTTANTSYDVEQVQSLLNMDSDVAGASARVDTTTIDATDLSNWYVYDHYDPACYSGADVAAREASWVAEHGYNRSLRPYYENVKSYRENTEYTQRGLVRTAEPITISQLASANAGTPSATMPWGYVYNFKEHIEASSENGKAAMNFYGYPEQPYTDFLFYPANRLGTKKVHYTVDATDVKTHSLNSAGFLFNTGITDVGGQKKLSGYVLLFNYKEGESNAADAIASGLNMAYIYKLANVDVNTMHSTSPVTKFGGTLIKSVDLSEITEYPFTDHFDVSDIAMEITANSIKVTMTEAGTSVTDPSSASTKTLFDITNLTDSGFGGFGPLVSYQSHSCHFTSSYKYSDLQMSITTTNSVLDGVNDTDFIEKGVDPTGANLVDSTRFFVLLGDNTQTETGYKDFFHLQDDAVLLEKLKRQKVVLITNLRTTPIAGNINGTDYRLTDYLGADNVIEIQDGPLNSMVTEIKQHLATATYNEAQAAQARDALQNVINVSGQNAAACQITYRGYQVDSIDRNMLPAAGITLQFSEPCKIGVTNPQYIIKKPDGTELNNGANSSFTVKATSEWPSGVYKAMVKYAEGIQVVTTFNITSLYDSYLNGVASSDGRDDDGVQARFGDVGVKTVKSGEDFVVVFPKTVAYDIPSTISVGVDANHNGIIEVTEQLNSGTDYTYDVTSTRGVLTVSRTKTTEDIYIEAAQAYTVRKVNWNFLRPVTWEAFGYAHQNKTFRSTDTELKAKLLWNDARQYFGEPSVSVKVNGVNVSQSTYSYDSTTGVFRMQKAAITGTVDVDVDRPFLEADVAVEKTHLDYSGPNKIAGTTDYVATISAPNGYALPQSIVLKHQPGYVADGGARQYVDYALANYQYNASTGVITLPASQFDGELKLIAEGVLQSYLVTAVGEHLQLQGAANGDVEHAYQGTMVADSGYELPEQIVVKRAGAVMTTGYTYDSTTGDIIIDQGEVYGDIVIEGDASKEMYPVTNQVEHLSFSGASEGDVEHAYTARIVADEYYERPSSVVVTRNEQRLTSGYTYDVQTGNIVIAQGQITGPIEIKAEAVPIAYQVAANLKNLTFRGPASGDVAHEYEGTIVGNGLYEPPTMITVKRAGVLMTSGYEYDPETGVVKIAQGQVTGDIEIRCSGVERKYDVTANIGHGTFLGDNLAYTLEDYEAYIRADKGYVLPEQVTVKVNGNAVTTDVTYHSGTGKIMIDASVIRGDIEILANAAPGLNNVVYELKHLKSEGAEQVLTHAEYTAKLKPSAINYLLPENIEVFVGDRQLESGKDYVYDHLSGSFAILQNTIDDTVTIVGEGTKIELKEEEKLPQPAPKEEDLTIIPPTYENIKDGKIIGVTLDMEYSLDGGKTWIPCDSNTISKLGVGTVMLRLKGDETKQTGAIVSLKIESETSEYYIPTISMTKKMGCKQKFQILVLNTNDAVLRVESTNPKVATVDSKGVIKTKKKEGKTKIVITALKGQHIVQYVAQVQVSKKIKKNYSLVKFDTKYKGPCIALYKLIYNGKSWKINMTHTKGTKIFYRSSNPSVATVNTKGKVTARQKGSATITITVENKNVIDQYFVVVRVANKGEKAKMPKYLKVLK